MFLQQEERCNNSQNFYDNNDEGNYPSNYDDFDRFFSDDRHDY